MSPAARTERGRADDTRGRQRNATTQTNERHQGGKIATGTRTSPPTRTLYTFPVPVEAQHSRASPPGPRTAADRVQGQDGQQPPPRTRPRRVNGTRDGGGGGITSPPGSHTEPPHVDKPSNGGGGRPTRNNVVEAETVGP